MKDIAKHKLAYNRETGQALAFTSENDIITYQNQPLEVIEEKTEDGLTFLTHNGKKHEIEVLNYKQNEYEILINGVSYSFSIESPFSLERKKHLLQKASESTTIRLKAPMPGKILEVMVKVGDSIKAGDTLLILEAMKMQNAILASVKGTIKKVLVKEGDTASKSDLLIEMEKDI